MLECSSTDYEGHKRLLTQVQGIVGSAGLNLLVNNAGIYIRSNLDAITPQDMITNYEVNTVAPLFLTRTLLPLLRASNQPPIVANISSFMGSIEKNEVGSFYAYRCAKAALNMVTKCLTVDLKNDGIRCVALHPGWVSTDMGGPKAPVTPSVSVSGMINVLANLTEEMNGKLVDFNGEIVPY